MKKIFQWAGAIFIYPLTIVFTLTFGTVSFIWFIGLFFDGFNFSKFYSAVTAMFNYPLALGFNTAIFFLSISSIALLCNKIFKFIYSFKKYNPVTIRFMFFIKHILFIILWMISITLCTFIITFLINLLNLTHYKYFYLIASFAYCIIFIFYISYDNIEFSEYYSWAIGLAISEPLSTILHSGILLAMITIPTCIIINTYKADKFYWLNRPVYNSIESDTDK